MNEIAKEEKIPEIKENFNSELFSQTDFKEDKAKEIYNALIKEESELEVNADKIYNRKESDFNFDNLNLERYTKVFEQYKKENWEHLGLYDRKDVNQVTCAYLALKMGISQVPKIIYMKGPSSVMGVYLQNTNTLVINSYYLDDPKEMLDTVSHEMRHAYQWERAKKLETEMDKLYDLNLKNYIRLERIEGQYVNFNDYEDQLVEAEARAFAKEIVKIMEGMEDGNHS